MTKTDEVPVCYLCGEQKVVTDDHVPPRSLSPKSPRTNFLFAPSCFDCNRNYDALETKFRDYLATGSSHYGNKSADFAYEAMRRGHQRNPLGRYLSGKPNKDFYRIASNLKLAQLFTPGGIYLGDAPLLKIPEDLDYEKELVKIAKGVLYQYGKKIVPNNYMSKAFFIKELIFPDDFKKCNLLGYCGDFFSFKGAIAPEDGISSVWYMSFYGRIAAWAVFIKPTRAIVDSR